MAGDAESIFRDFAGSVTRAADTARESDQADQMKSAFRDAAGEVRETFNVAVNQVRNRGGEKGEDSSAESTIADMRSRLDDLLNRLGSTFDSEDEGPSDIIDGEVVEDN